MVTNISTLKDIGRKCRKAPDHEIKPFYELRSPSLILCYLYCIISRFFYFLFYTIIFWLYLQWVGLIFIGERITSKELSERKINMHLLWSHTHKSDWWPESVMRNSSVRGDMRLCNPHPEYSLDAWYWAQS